MSVNGRMDCLDAKNFLACSQSFCKKAASHIGSSITSELAHSKNVFADAAKSTARELGASSCIWLGTLAAASSWGIINDLIASAIYPDYFTKGYTAQKYRHFSQNSKRFRWIKWAAERVVASGLAIPLIHAARASSLAKLNILNYLRAGSAALMFMGVSSGIAGLFGYVFSKNNQCCKRIVKNVGCTLLPENEHHRCIAATCAHNVGYFANIVAGLSLCGWTIRQRYLLSQSH